MQNLVFSAQRGLPVNLLATAIEPLLVTKSIVRGERSAAESALSLLIKLETIIILFGVVIIAPCSSWVVMKLGKPEFSAYGFVLPILMIYGLCGSYYRVLETVAGIAQIYITFLAALPISIAALFLVYETTASLGITALLIWPSIETLARLAIVVYALRLHGVKRVFDFSMLALLLLIAALLICLTEVSIWHFALGDTETLIASLVGGVIFVLFLFVVRPFSGEEHHIFIDILKPKSLAVLRLSRHLTR